MEHFAGTSQELLGTNDFTALQNEPADIDTLLSMVPSSLTLSDDEFDMDLDMTFCPPQLDEPLDLQPEIPELCDSIEDVPDILTSIIDDPDLFGAFEEELEQSLVVDNNLYSSGCADIPSKEQAGAFDHCCLVIVDAIGRPMRQASLDEVKICPDVIISTCSKNKTPSSLIPTSRATRSILSNISPCGKDSMLYSKQTEPACHKKGQPQGTTAADESHLRQTRSSSHRISKHVSPTRISKSTSHNAALSMAGGIKQKLANGSLRGNGPSSVSNPAAPSNSPSQIVLLPQKRVSRPLLSYLPQAEKRVCNTLPVSGLVSCEA